MARPTQFDREEVLDRALQLFWRQGYTTTSMPQLLKAMDIRPSSFYSSFGSKRDLYRECLTQYTDSLQSLVDQISLSNDPLHCIERYFSITFSGRWKIRLASGCLMVNTAIELEDVDSELYQQAVDQMENVEQAFAKCFANAQAIGRMRTDMSPQDLTQFFGTVNAGIRVKLRSGTPKTILLEQIENLIQFLGIDRSFPTYSSKLER